MRVLDVCCGAGGLSLGFQCAGHTVRGVDAWDDAIATYRANVGAADLCDIADYAPGQYDVVIGGIPCQPFSAASRGYDYTHAAGNHLHFARIVLDSGARYALVENSPLFLRSPEYTELVAILGEPLAEVVPFSRLGVPQRRERMILRWGDWGPIRYTDRVVTIGEALGLPDYEPDNRGKGQGQRTHDPRLPAYTITRTMDRIMTHSELRYMRPGEAAALQTFPADYAWRGNAQSVLKQIANAVPPLGAYHLALTL